MNEPDKTPVLESLSKTIRDFGIELDALEAAQRKAARSRYLNVVQVPAARLIGFLIGSVLVFLHNRYLSPDMPAAQTWRFLIAAVLYSLGSWGILFVFFERVKRFHLGDFFLCADLFLFAFMVYCSGGEKSWLFPVFVTRIADQVITSRGRVFFFAFASAGVLLGLMWYLETFEGHVISWPVELTKVVFLIAVNVHLIVTATFVGRLRHKLSKAVKLSTTFTEQLHVKALELERARVEIEQMFKRELDVNRTLSELNQMKTNFLIITSHEMRTPLTIIKGYNEALLGQFFGSLSDGQKRSLEACQHAVDRLTMTLGDIVEMLKISEGHIALKLERVDLSEILRQIRDEFTPFIEKRGQTVTLESPGELVVVADRKKIHLVFLNLVQNAVKFTQDNGHIDIRAEIGETATLVSVQDTGIGIEPTELERIFERFYTNEDPGNHTSGTYQFMARGTGLGLSIVKSYVEAHGGRIWAESEGVGKGSRFVVSLPLTNQGSGFGVQGSGSSEG